MTVRVRVTVKAVTLLLLISIFINNGNLAEAAKLRRGSVKSSEEIEDISFSDERSLWSVGTLTDAEAFAMKKTPTGPLKSSKCGIFLGGDSASVFRSAGMLRKQHPRCNQDKGGITTLPPIGAPTSVGPTLMPTTASPTTPLPTMSPTTPIPSAAPTETLNCVQSVMGTELIIPLHKFFDKGEVHCLKDDDGQQAYFGYNWSNQFGLFVNGEAIWTAPEASVAASDRWIFQSDGNLLLRDSNNQGVWRTHTGGNYGSLLKVSFDRVWIEDDTGSTLWFQPPLQEPPMEPSLQPSSGSLTENLPTNPPTQLQGQGLRFQCVQNVRGTKLTIPVDEQFRKGDMHCLISDDNRVAYFGYNWLNEFGLFVNTEAVWTIPSALGSFDHWTFEEDGNLVMKDANAGAIWTSQSHGNFGSRLTVSFDRVWIETDFGDRLWSQPPYTEPPLDCVQTVTGNELEVTPLHTFFRKGEVHCLRLGDGEQAYFGYNWSNQFGLFVNGEALWMAPETSVAASDRWIFQTDGNLLLRDANAQGLWRTHTSGNYGSSLRVSFERVWIESNNGSTLWSQPPNKGPPTPPSDGLPTASPSRNQDRSVNCVQSVTGDQLSIPSDTTFRKGDLHCLTLDDGEEVYFGHTWSNKFGFFVNDQSVWTVPDSVLASVDRWAFQGDGNLVLRDRSGDSIWTTDSEGNWNSQLRVSSEGVWIERNTGYTVWAQPPYLKPLSQSTSDYNPSTTGGLQYYAYYYPWYHRNNWSRHDYQDEPLLGKYGTNEVDVAEQHIQWAREAGISTWIVSWWGQNHFAMNHFKAGMINAPSLNKMKFAMLYESAILDGRGSWRDGSKEEALYQDLKVIRDEFFNHPSYLKINGRPVIIFYITRSRMPYEAGFNGPAVLANMRRRLGHNIYFIADEPFFDWDNKSPDGNENAFKNGQQVFDAYTTYNMFQDSRVRRGETATDYQLRESMPVWKRWAEQVPLFPNVMPQYYDFRGHKPLLGNSADFMRQLQEVACLPRTNFNGAPHIMFVTSFNQWWEGTQIEPENGSRDNWNNYGFQFLETLAAFKKEVDSRGAHWC